MNIHVARDGQVIGEFSESEFREKIYRGEIYAEDFYWCEEMSDWAPVSHYRASGKENAPRIVPPEARTVTAHPAVSKERRTTARYNTPGLTQQPKEVADQDRRSARSSLRLSNLHNNLFAGVSKERVILLDTPAILGLLGGAILTLGVFAPVVHAPIFGSLNYFQNGKGDGVILIVAGIATLVLSAFRKFNWLWLTGFVSLGCALFTIGRFVHGMAGFKKEIARYKDDALFSGITSAMVNSVELQWGLPLLRGWWSCRSGGRSDRNREVTISFAENLKLTPGRWRIW
jgi:hypothetical protein